MRLVTLTKTNKILQGEIHLPGSKSISNRTLIVNHLSKNQLRLQHLSTSDDTRLMARLLDVVSKSQPAQNLVELNCENAGTVLRFLTALLAITPGDWIITGTGRMKERPVGILVDALRMIGADIEYLEKEGFPPLLVHGNRMKGGKIKIDASVSSQFVSALLLIAPNLENGLILILTNKLSSKPYIEMTLALLKHVGIDFSVKGNTIDIKRQNFESKSLYIESDWSSAAYWYEMAAFADEADIILKTLQRPNPSILTSQLGLMENPSLLDPSISVQGDSILPQIYQSFGVNTEMMEFGIRLTKKGKPVSRFDFDFTNHPDLAQSVIVTCAGLGIKGTFTGLESLRIKETNRINALLSELQKFGFIPEIVQDTKLKFQIHKPDIIKKHQSKIKNQKSKIINPFGDHRMAMAFAPLVLLMDVIRIENPHLVSKSYPTFWDDLRKMKIDTWFFNQG